jgi:hypothetical protein
MLMAVWLYGALGMQVDRPPQPEQPTQAYAHTLMAEWLLAHGDRVGAAEELRYALIFDHENAVLKARLQTLSPVVRVAKKSGRMAWINKQLRKKSIDSLPIEDKASRVVAEQKAD